MSPYLGKNPSQKRADGVGQLVGSEFKPPVLEKKNKLTTVTLIIHFNKKYNYSIKNLP
jgi:hypothetical protein